MAKPIQVSSEYLQTTRCLSCPAQASGRSRWLWMRLQVTCSTRTRPRAPSTGWTWTERTTTTSSTELAAAQGWPWTQRTSECLSHCNQVSRRQAQSFWSCAGRHRLETFKKQTLDFTELHRAFEPDENDLFTSSAFHNQWPQRIGMDSTLPWFI